MSTTEAADLLKCALSTTLRPWLLSALNVVRDLVVDVAMEDAAGGLLQTLAESISTPSMEL
jgi:hypothetical protein